MTDSLRQAAEDLKRQLAEKIEAIKVDAAMAEVLRLQQALNGIEDVLGTGRSTLASAFGLDGGEEDRAPAMRSDEFFGITPLEAAKKYLKRRGEARPLAEIATAIRKYGGEPGSVESLRESLSRSTYQVAKVGEDLYGLVEFYPHISRRRGKRGAAGMAEADQQADDEEPAGEIKAVPGAA